MRLATSPSRFVILWLMGLFLLGTFLEKPLRGQETPLSEEEKREQVATERFLQLLLRRPTTGTALERVFGFHVARGTLSELLADLGKKAEQATKDGDEQTAGNHWMVIGLLQLQRGEEADAAEALAKAEAALKDNPLTAYHHGQALLLLGKDEAAALAMQRAIDLKPPRQDFLNIATQLGSLYQRAGKADAALGIWKQLEDSFPGDDGVRQRIARALADEGDLANALKRYVDLAKDARSPNDRIVFALRAADLHVQLGRKEQATKDLENLLTRLRPGSYLYAEARRRIENAFLDSGDYAGLAEYYEKWIADHPEDVGAVLRLARTLSVQGRGSEALKWLEKAIERSPSDRAPRLALIDTYIAEERYADAAAQYEKLAEMEPKNPDHLVRWGQLVLEDPKKPKEERKTAAAGIWKRLADARPDDAVIQSQVADLLRGAELKEAAIAGYRKAIELAPQEPQYKEYLGEYLHRLDRHQEALPVWRSIALGDLRTRENLVRLAEVLHQFDEPEEALQTLGKACEMDPNITERLRYAEWLRDDGSFDEALQQLELAGEQTDTVDDRDKVFTAEVKTYQAAGQLEKQIKEARQKAEAAMNNGESWRRLAILCEANNQTRESLEAIENAVKHSGDSIDTLDVAARMYETAGRLQEAIEKRRLLADADRRFRSGHLQRLASLYMRIGQAEEALATGKLLLAGGGGSLESFKFYADLCGQVGKTEERLDTYRRCLRINPRSTEAQQLLASQLAEDFKTEQAIELYWNMLDSSSELEDRRGVVRSLTDLYLRSNRLDQLISRLEIRGRESGDRRATIDLIATAYEQAGDLGLAREALEGLLREQGRDTLLLDRLVALAEKAGEAEEAVELQRQLMRLAPSRQSEAKLASLLIDIGAMDEAEVLWMRLTEQSADRDLTTRNLNRLFAAGETGVAIRLAKKLLESNPDDWETRFQLMVLEASEGQWEEAAKTANELRAMSIEDTALPAGGKPYQATVTRNGQTYQQPPLKFMRSQDLYSLYQILDERYGYRQNTTLPKPMDFGHAKLMAQWVVIKQDQANLKSHLEEAEKKAKADDATADDVWAWYETVNVARTMDSSVSLNYQKPETWEPLWKLVEADPKSGSMGLVSLLYNRWSISLRNREVALSPLAEDKLEWLKEKAKDDDPSDAAFSWYGNFNWALVYDSEMRIAGHDQNVDERFKDHVAKVLKEKDLKQAVPLSSLILNQGDDEQLWALIELMRSNPQDPVIKQRYGSNTGVNVACLSLFADRIDNGLTKGPADALYRERVMTLLEAMLADEAGKPVRRSSIRLTSVGQTRYTHIQRGSSYEQVNITFPPQGLGPDDQFIRTLWMVHGIFKEHPTVLTKKLQTEEPDADPRLRILRKMVAGMLLEWNEQTGQAIKEISEAVKIAEKEAPHSESELRLLWVDLLLRQGQKRQALEVIDGLTVYDQNTMAVREFAAAKLAAALDDKERAQAAAKRLFGVRLETDAQIELAKLMRSLDMHELASDLVRRMRSRGGSNTEQLNSLITYFVAQGDKEQAAEVAVELLRRSVPSRRQTSNYTTVTEARRRSALQTLANVGRLTSLIEATEERLKRSPKSQRIRGELAEMYVSAGQPAKAQELLGDSVSGTSSLAALEQAAKQLLAAGKMDEACDAYLKILRRKPELFQNDYYEITRPFEQTKRLGDLADLVMEVGINRFESYRVAELCRRLAEDAKQKNKFKTLYLAMLEVPPTSNNSMQSLHQIVGYSRNTLNDEEVLAKTQEYMIKASLQSAGDWSALFYGYSTGSDGRHSNAATRLVDVVAEDEKKAQALEDLIRKTLKENENWYEGRAWLGTLLVVRKQFDEATKLLEPLLDQETKPAPTYTVFWLIGSLIDKHKPMQELALRMYQHAIDKHASQIHERGSEFRYSLSNRACQLMKDMGKRAEARELVLTSVAKREKTPSPYRSNDDYEAYRQIQERNSVIAVLKELDYPADALRMARTFDMSLFDKAGQYERGLREPFIKQRGELLKEVRELGGLATVESMIDAEAAGARAVDLGITIGERPFTETGIQSLWIELVAEARNKPESSGQLKALREQLNGLHEKRPQDDSAALAYSIAADVANDPQPLRELLSTWISHSEEEQIDDPAFRRQAVILGLIHLGRSEAEEDRKFVQAIVSEKLKDWSWEYRMLLLAELGREALKRDDKTSAQKHWRSLLKEPQSQLLLLDLAHAAAVSQMPVLSCDAVAAAAGAPEKALSTTTPAAQTNSLGSLLSTGNRQSSSTSSNTQTQLDAAEIRLAQRLLELDTVWRTNKVAPKKACEALMKIVFGEAGTSIKPLCIPVVVRPNNNLAVDSVYDRLARRAKSTKLTGEVLAKLSNNDPASHLLSGLALLRNDQREEALKHYAQVDPARLNALPKETVLQALLPALNDDICRGEILRIGNAFVGQNKPTQRYQNIDPFDTFAFMLSRTAIQNGQLEPGLQAINDYLEISQHQNDRYSGGSYGLTRRIEQLNNVSRLLSSKGHIEKALSFAGMRQSLFEMGMDTSNDAVGTVILQRIENRKDRKNAYQTLADWTLAGDGPLAVISGLVHRQPLPDWIPEDVGGKYPRFSPVPSETFPIVSNYYALAKLAVETNQTEDLLKRLREAHQQQRGGSAEALAMALVVGGQPVREDLLREIVKRMDESLPDGNEVKGSVPLAAMQLATLLAHESEYEGWAREIASKFEPHGVKSRRGFLMRWLTRYQYERGWSENSQLKPADSFMHWLPSSSAPAGDYANGLTPPVWLTDGKSQLSHLCGIGDDRFWFRYPLEGDFEFQVELSDGNWSESSVLANGLRFGPNAHGKYIDVASHASRDWIRFPTSTLKANEWHQHTFRFEGDTFTYLVNGTPIYKEARRKDSPWIAWHSPGLHYTAARNLRFTGEPRVLREVNLLPDDSLRDWSGQYYNQGLASAKINEDVHEPDAQKANRYRTAQDPNDLANLAWTVKDGELVSGKSPAQGAAARKGQSVIRYERPLAAGETLSYEFYYEADQTLVHPAIGRTAYILHPEGVRRHWMREVAGNWKLPHDYEAPVNAENPIGVPLKEADWNRVTLEHQQNNLRIRVNHEVVFDQEIEILPQGTIFGLFHYADQTKARVRNVTLTGPWAESIPENLFEEANSE